MHNLRHIQSSHLKQRGGGGAEERVLAEWLEGEAAEEAGGAAAGGGAAARAVVDVHGDEEDGDAGGGGGHYVCNPATGKWVTLPVPASGFQALAIAAFQPHGAGPRFHVLNFARTEPARRVFFDVDFEDSSGDDSLSDADGIGEEELLDFYGSASYAQGLEVFSSETGKWVTSNAGKASCVRPVEGIGSVFLDGFVNLLTHEKKVLSVDPESRESRLISLPGFSWFGSLGCLGQSQGLLHYAAQQEYGCPMIQVWVLKDFEKGEWMMKQRFEIEVAPQTKVLFDYAGSAFGPEIFYVVLFHPEKDVVFLPVEGYKLLSYNLKNAEVQEICKFDQETRPRFLVYVPSYADLSIPDVPLN